MTDKTAFGPQGPNYTTSRPARDTEVSGGVDTWFTNCSSAGSTDGTYATADFFNVIVDNLRTLVRGGGVTLDGTSGSMLLNAVKAVATSIASSVLSAASPPVMHAWRSANQGVSVGVSTTLTSFQTLSNDDVDVSGSTVTIKTSGKYQINWTAYNNVVSSAAGPAPVAINLALKRNGAYFGPQSNQNVYIPEASLLEQISLGSSTVRQLDEGDVIVMSQLVTGSNISSVTCSDASIDLVRLL